MSHSDHTLIHYLPHDSDAETALMAFMEYTQARQLTLYPAQEEALLEVFDDRHIILNTPTGSGKSLIAKAVHFWSLCRNKRSYYTAPIKALVSEKFFDLCHEFGPDNVGMMTGDASINSDAPILCCTAEILAQKSLREGKESPIDDIVIDEFHYYADKERGVAWQIPLLTLPQCRFLLMSATLGEADVFKDHLSELNAIECSIVQSHDRPVPLDFEYRETPMHETLEDILSSGKYPIYIVHFTQRAAAEQAQRITSINILSKEAKKTILQAMAKMRFDSPYGKDLKRYLQHGIGVHHAGLLPKYRLLVEQLAQQGLLKVICGTDTLGVGVNVPIRSVILTSLCKFDGQQTKLLSARDFHQICGRAGRKGFDVQGSVIAQAPEHVIENKQIEKKLAANPQKRKKTVFRKAPTRAYVHWDKAVFERLTQAQPEALESQFRVSHSMLLQVLSRPDAQGCAAMKKLIKDCHDTPQRKAHHSKQAWSMFRALLEAEVVQLVPKDNGLAGKQVRLNEALQYDFSLNQSLSLYVLHAIEQLDREYPEYALQLLSVIESILENPRTLLLKQRDKLRQEAMKAMKAEGMDYDERIEELEKIDYSKPEAEFIYTSFNEFAAHHPWLEGENIRPKGIVRDMYEEGHSFNSYVKEYGLQRSEGVLLRYLSDAYKACLQNIPEANKDEAFVELNEWLGTIVRSTDSSLLDAWEALVCPDQATQTKPSSQSPSEPDDITQDTRRFTVLLRNATWRLLRALAQKNYAWISSEGIANGREWSAEQLSECLSPYWQDYDCIETHMAARAPRWCVITMQEQHWQVRQTLHDPDENFDWALTLQVDLKASRERAEPVLLLKNLGASN